MDIKEKIKLLTKKKAEVVNELYQAKSEFKQYITNKEIPVLERWKFFINAPNELKEQSKYIIRPENEFLNYFVHNKFDAPEIYGRGKTIYVATMLNNLVYSDSFNEEDYFYEEFGEEVIKQGIEELLEMNLEYFCLDW